jgi:guanosine-3',5'-bis(diphosphate) 3'-pyrophosphohydrolase
MVEDQVAEQLFDAALFAAKKHQGQVRKDRRGSPYITHPLTVAKTLWVIGGVRDGSTLVAAILHDTLEDTCTTQVEIRECFGEDILRIILEVSDDKSLEKIERKRLEVLHASEISSPAKLIKLGDKLANCRDILESPPNGWPLLRRQHYMQWAADVVAGLRGVNPPLENAFDQMLIKAENQLQFSIQPYSTVNQRLWAPHPSANSPKE